MARFAQGPSSQLVHSLSSDPGVEVSVQQHRSPSETLGRGREGIALNQDPPINFLHKAFWTSSQREVFLEARRSPPRLAFLSNFLHVAVPRLPPCCGIRAWSLRAAVSSEMDEFFKI